MYQDVKDQKEFTRTIHFWNIPRCLMCTLYLMFYTVIQIQHFYESEHKLNEKYIYIYHIVGTTPQYMQSKHHRKRQN